MLDFFVNTTADGDYTLTTASIVLLIAAIVLLTVVSVLIAQKGKVVKISTKTLVFCAVAMALALVTSKMEIYSFPFGGSVTLFSMLFVCLIGYLYGAKVSIPVAIAYGILQFLIKPYIYHPVQILFDYPLAFGALGLSGLFWKQKNGLLKGYIAGILGRWVFASVSGYVFFAAYAWEGWNPLLYTLVYNGCYIFAEAVSTVIILFLPPVVNAFSQVKRMANE